MVRSVKPYIALALVFTTLAGCSIFQRAERPAWRDRAEDICLAEKLVHVSSYVQPAPPIDGPGICGMNHPFKTTALAEGTVMLDSRATLACPMLPMLDRWIIEVVQPLAQARFGEQIVEIKTMGSYGCRSIDHMRGASLSEHAFGNAIDIAGFRLASGREINVMRGWKSTDDQERAFLHEAQAGACNYFTTVLAPGADAFHYNHIHVDLAHHAMMRDGTMHRVCKPLPDDSNIALPNLTPPDVNAEAEDVTNPQGAISLAPISAAAPQINYGNTAYPKTAYSPRRTSAPVELMPPASINGAAALEQESPPPDIDVSRFDLPSR